MCNSEFNMTSSTSLIKNENDVSDGSAESKKTQILLSPCASMNSNCSDDGNDDIGKLFEQRSVAIEKWLREKAPPEVIAKIHSITENNKAYKSLKRPSVTSELFQQWLASSPMSVGFKRLN